MREIIFLNSPSGTFLWTILWKLTKTLPSVLFSLKVRLSDQPYSCSPFLSFSENWLPFRPTFPPPPRRTKEQILSRSSTFIILRIGGNWISFPSFPTREREAKRIRTSVDLFLFAEWCVTSQIPALDSAGFYCSRIF